MKSLRLITGAALTGALLVAHAVVAVAATGTTTASGESTPLNLSGTSSTGHTASSSTGSSLVRTIVGLFIVIAVIYGIAWIMRQAKRGSNPRAKGKALTPVASLPLGSGRSVQLVRAGSELLLLGVAEQGVVPIRSYSEAEALEAGLELPDGTESEAGPQEDSAPLARLLDALRRLTVRS